MMPRLPSLAVLAVLLSGWSIGALAQDLPAPGDTSVLDLAEVLDPTAEGRIERLIAETQDSTGVEMKVVTMTDIASHGGAGERLDAYAARLLEAWQIGAPDRNDGILFLITTEPVEARIALGSAYAPVYDERAARVLGLAVLPALREGRMPDGIEAGVILARDQLVGPFLDGTPVTAFDGFEGAAPELPSFLPYVLLLAAAAGVTVFLYRRKVQLQKTCPRCGDLTLTRTFEVIEPPTRQSEGSGIEHRLCESCGYTDRQVYELTPGTVGGYRRKLGR